MKRLFLYSFIFLLVLVIPASAHLMIENGTGIIVSNVTEYSRSTNSYAVISTISGADLYGWHNISFKVNSTLDGADVKVVFQKNGVNISDIYDNTNITTVWQTKYNNYYGLVNSSDVFTLFAKGASTQSIYVKDFNISANYTVAPIILTLANNSAQTSRALNVTWSSNVSNVRVQASTQSDFSNLLWNATSLTGYYNVTVPTGLIYFHVRGEDAGNNSETNWSVVNQYLIYDSLELKGGYGYNYTSAGWIFDNTFTDFSSNDIAGGGIWGIDFEDNRMPNWTNGSGQGGTNWVVQNGQLNQTALASANDVHYHFNDTNFTDFDVLTLMKYKRSGSVADLLGLDYRVQNWSGTLATSTRKGYGYQGRRSTGLNYFSVDSPSGNYVLNSTSYLMVIENWYYLRTNINGSNMYGKIWNISEPDWQSYQSDTNYTWGKLGVVDHQAAANYEFIWVRNLSGSTFLKNGTATSEIITAGFNKSVSGFSINSSIPTNNIISMEVRISSDNITWNDWISMGALSNQSNILLNSSYANQYAQVRFTMNNTDYTYPKIYNFSVLSTNVSKISGYVNHANGTAMDNASVIYAVGVGSNYSIYTTNLTGYYEFRALPRSQIVLVAGKTGFDANGTLIRNITSDSNIEHNFSLNVSVPVFSNIMSNESHEIFNRFSQYIDENGHLSSTEGYDDGYFQHGEFDMQILGAYLYSSGQNRSLYSTEKTLRWLVHSSDVLLSGVCQHEYINLSDSAQYTIYNYTTGQCQRQGYYYYNYAKGVYILRSFLDVNTWDYINSTFTEAIFNGNGTQNYSQQAFRYGSGSNINENYSNTDWWGTNFTDLDALNFSEKALPNVVFNSIVPYQISSTFGHNIDQTIVNNVMSKFANQTDENGYIRWSEIRPSSVYYCAMTKMSYELMIYGYVPVQNVYDAINRSTTWCENLELISGENLPLYRSTGSVIEDLVHGELVVVQEPTGASYRQLDLSISKAMQSKFQLGSYYAAKNYFDPTDEVGYAGYTNYVMMNALVGSQFAFIGSRYDASIPETNRTYLNMDDYNSSGLMILQSNGLSVGLLKNVSTHEVYLGQGRGFIPLRFVPVVEHQDYFSIYPHININQSCCNYTDLFIKLNGSRINTSKINYVPVTHAFTNNSLWINYTGLGFMEGATEKIIDYYNLSVVENNGILHMKYEVGYNPATFNIQNYSDGIDFATNDNRTIAVITNTSNGILYVRGNNTINMTDITVTNGVLSGINNNSGIWGKGQFGYNNRTLINSSVTGSPFIIEYDMNITTTNVYGYMLNNPPGVFTTSPDTPLNTGLGSQTFDIEFTQSLDNISWNINGTIKEWDNGTSTGSYTNSTAGTGIYNVTATGCNAQGCASFSWIWTVDGTAPASVTNVVAVSNTTHFNMSWTNPVDSDFNHIEMRNITGELLTNLTNQSWNVLGTPHKTFNYSSQTVDILGNVNPTKVWFNGTIQNQPITLSGVSSSYSLTSGATLAIDAGYSDPDSDVGTFQDNSSLWNIDTSTGVVSWVGVEGDYDWQIGVSDGYGSIAYQNFTVSVSTQILYPNPVTGCSAVMGYYYVNISCSAVQP